MPVNRTFLASGSLILTRICIVLMPMPVAASTIIGIAIGYLIAFYLMAQTLNELPLGFVYAVWTGAGVALTAIIGAIVWNEGFNAKKAIGIAAIIVGVVFLKIGV